MHWAAGRQRWRLPTPAAVPMRSPAAAALGVSNGRGHGRAADIAAAVTVADSGVGADSQRSALRWSVTDTGAGVDTILQMILIAITDAGTAVDKPGPASPWR